jgi:hypothetical protein
VSATAPLSQHEIQRIECETIAKFQQIGKMPSLIPQDQLLAIVATQHSLTEALQNISSSSSLRSSSFQLQQQQDVESLVRSSSQKVSCLLFLTSISQSISRVITSHNPHSTHCTPLSPHFLNSIHLPIGLRNKSILFF